VLLVSTGMARPACTEFKLLPTVSPATIGMDRHVVLILLKLTVLLEDIFGMVNSASSQELLLQAANLVIFGMGSTASTTVAALHVNPDTFGTDACASTTEPTLSLQAARAPTFGTVNNASISVS
jgi:hypothetical protein